MDGLVNPLDPNNILSIVNLDNGMAAIINPLGYIENKIDYGVSGYIDLEDIRDFKPTLFSKYGNNIFFTLILLYIVLTFSFNRIKNE